MSSEIEEVVLGNGIVSFDGRVLECFGLGLSHPSYRMHAVEITRIELLQKRRGAALEVDIRGSHSHGAAVEADASQLAALEQLIAKIDQGRQP